jgi:endoribonuclease Dicer
MTASPVDSKTDFKEGVAALESLLDCTIITTTDMSLVEAVNRPSEVVLKYKPPLTHDYDSLFLSSLKQMCVDQDAFLPILKRASEISKHFGHWCADQFLLDNICSDNQEQILRAGKKHLPNLASTSETDVANAVADATKTIQAVIDHVHERRSRIEEANTEELRRRYAEENTNRSIIAGSSTEVSNIISPKVAKLLAYLTLEFERENEQRCIVFVEWKHAARLLCRLLNTVGITNLRSGFVMGAGKEAVNDGLAFTLRSQILSLARFRSGETNCMIATAVAAEGLDIPSCNLVIRFSIYKTMIEYVQSRGKTDSAHSNPQMPVLIARANVQVEHGDEIPSMCICLKKGTIRKASLPKRWFEEKG